MVVSQIVYQGARRFNEVTKDVFSKRLAETGGVRSCLDTVSLLLKAENLEIGQFLTASDIGSETGHLVTTGRNFFVPKSSNS